MNNSEDHITTIATLGLLEPNASSSNSMSADVQYCINFRFIVNTLVMTPMCLLGFACNTLSLVALRQDGDAPVASFLLRCVALSDNLYIVAWLVTYSVKDAIAFYRSSNPGDLPAAWTFIRVYTYPTLYVAQTQMIWFTVVIAFNRLVAVCFPFSNRLVCSKRNVRLIAVGVITFSIVYNVPRFCERYVTVRSSRDVEIVGTVLERSELYHVVYVDVCYYVFSFFLPVLLLLVCSCCVVTRLWTRRRQTATVPRREMENNVTVVMIVVVLVFIMCQAPARLVQIIWSYSYAHCRQFQYFLIQASNTLEVLNSSLNFVVYCLFHRNFRIFLCERVQPRHQQRHLVRGQRPYVRNNGREMDGCNSMLTSAEPYTVSLTRGTRRLLHDNTCQATMI
jgi:hypothetical protein